MRDEQPLSLCTLGDGVQHPLAKQKHREPEKYVLLYCNMVGIQKYTHYYYYYCYYCYNNYHYNRPTSIT